MTKVKANDKVKVHYTGTLSDGAVFDTSLQREPLEFTAGAGQMIKGFDDAVLGMEVEESKKVTIPCAEAYGDVDEKLIFDVPNSQLPADLKPEVGLQLMSQNQEGQQFPVTVKEVKEESVTIDANHQLAGQDLTFEIKVVSIN